MPTLRELGSVPLPRPDPRGVHPDWYTRLILPTPIPNIVGMNINPALWENFIASQPQSKNIERPPPVDAETKLKVDLGLLPRQGLDPYPPPPTLEQLGREPDEMSRMLGYFGIR